MPSFGTYFSDEEAPAVEAAARISPEKKVAPYIAEAVRQRMAREGTLPTDPRAELLAAAEEVGMDRALDALKRAARTKKHAA
jgi:hypothetical protein